MSRIIIVDYGMGNIRSVANAFARLGADYAISNDATDFSDGAAIVLPGVGAFHAAMENLRARGLDEALGEQVLIRQKPFLGICLGLQLIAKDSVESGYATGLGWIDGHVLKLEPVPHHPVPHVGWNEVVYRPESPLFQRVEEGAHFYFDHSFHLQCSPELITSRCDYGGEWVASIQKENILACQFHPEKSQRNGLRLLRNFLSFVDAC